MDTKVDWITPGTRGEEGYFWIDLSKADLTLLMTKDEVERLAAFLDDMAYDGTMIAAQELRRAVSDDPVADWSDDRD